MNHKHLNQRKIKQIRFLFRHKENCLLKKSNLLKKYVSCPNLNRNWNCSNCNLFNSSVSFYCINCNYVSCLAPIFRDVNSDDSEKNKRDNDTLYEQRRLSFSMSNLTQDRCQLCLFNRYDLYPKNQKLNDNNFNGRRNLIINNYQTMKKLSSTQIINLKKLDLNCSYKRQHSDPDSVTTTEKSNDDSLKRNLLVKSTSLNTMQPDNYYENHAIIRKYKVGRC